MIHGRSKFVSRDSQRFWYSLQVVIHVFLGPGSWRVVTEAMVEYLNKLYCYQERTLALLVIQPLLIMNEFKTANQLGSHQQEKA